jgi:predicted O-methyltransferase YrrM
MSDAARAGNDARLVASGDAAIMKFEQVYGMLASHQRERPGWYVVLGEDTLREIYQHVVATGAKDCLELGTAFGSTTCVMAAAVEENGGGMVTTIDRIGRRPVGVAELAELTGLTQYVRGIELKAGYNWFLLGALREQTRGAVCEPCYDFCFLDGAHLWEPDALATLLATKLLRPGGWLLMDDLHFKPRSIPGWERIFSDASNDELNTSQVGMVFDLVVKSHPDLERFSLSYAGHMGWARKRGGTPGEWRPGTVIAEQVTGSWSRSHDGVSAIRNQPHSEGVVIAAQQGGGAFVRATLGDPWVQLSVPNQPLRPVDYVTLRVRMVSPDIDFVQIFWIGVGDSFFSEARSMRCLVRSLREPQDLTFRIGGTELERTIRMLRLDPADGPCELLLASLTVGGW